MKIDSVPALPKVIEANGKLRSEGMELLNVILAAICNWLKNRSSERIRIWKDGVAEYRHARRWLWRARLASSEDERQDALEEARIAIRQAIRIGMPDSKEWFEVASLAEELEELHYAAMAYQKAACSRSPVSVEATVRLAALRAKEGRKGEAKRIVSRALKLNPHHQEARELAQELSREEI
ncbi:MAG: hypothetical protein HPY58_13900 [Firmicutes bacterium]|nr:hypothetical protein [Bacillota bacterium]